MDMPNFAGAFFMILIMRSPLGKTPDCHHRFRQQDVTSFSDCPRQFVEYFDAMMMMRPEFALPLRPSFRCRILIRRLFPRGAAAASLMPQISRRAPDAADDAERV